MVIVRQERTRRSRDIERRRGEFPAIPRSARDTRSPGERGLFGRKVPVISVQNENITTDSGGITISDTAQFIVYTLEFCPNCEILKEFLSSRGASFIECDMASAEALTELRMGGIFVREAPVLQKGEEFYTSADLFGGGAFREDLVADLIAEA
jgi:glutaredoxin